MNYGVEESKGEDENNRVELNRRANAARLARVRRDALNVTEYSEESKGPEEYEEARINERSQRAEISQRFRELIPSEPINRPLQRLGFFEPHGNGIADSQSKQTGGKSKKRKTKKTKKSKSQRNKKKSRKLKKTKKSRK